MGERIVIESPVRRGIDEEFAYQFTLTGKLPAGTYANAANALFSADSTGAFVTAVTGWNNGSPSVTSTTFTTSKFTGGVLSAGTRYMLRCNVDVDGDQWSWILFIEAEL